jgi:hypothetical protein
MRILNHLGCSVRLPMALRFLTPIFMAQRLPLALKLLYQPRIRITCVSHYAWAVVFTRYIPCILYM